MKIGTMFRFAIDFIFKRKLKFFFVSIMFIISIVLIDLVVVEYYSIEHVKYEVEGIIDYNIRDIGYIQYSLNDQTNMNSDTGKKVLSEISKIDGVKKCGAFDDVAELYEELYNNDSYLKLRENIVKNMVERKYQEFDEITRMMYAQNLKAYSNVLMINKDLEGFCQLKLDKGDSGKIEQDMTPIVIGHNYKELIKIGQVLTNRVTKKKYVVTGILKENSRWISNGDIRNNLNISVDLDDYFVIYDEALLNYDSSYVVFDKNRENVEVQLKEKINRINSKNNINLRVVMLDEKFNEMRADVMAVSKAWIVLAIFSLIIGMLSMVSISIATLILNKSDFGIMYSVGFSQKDIKNIIILENLVQIGFGCVMGFCMATFISVYGNTKNITETVLNIQCSKGALCVIGIFIVSSIIASVVPIIYISKRKPSELIV